jgi:hypothetical protein
MRAKTGGLPLGEGFGYFAPATADHERETHDEVCPKQG